MSYQPILQQQEAGNPSTSAERLTELSAYPELRILVVGNPAAPASLLEHLAHDQDAQVREKVASNPNTPWQILEHLAWEFPSAFLHNPLGPIQILAHAEHISTNSMFW